MNLEIPGAQQARAVMQKQGCQHQHTNRVDKECDLDRTEAVRRQVAYEGVVDRDSCRRKKHPAHPLQVAGQGQC